MLILSGGFSIILDEELRQLDASLNRKATFVSAVRAERQHFLANRRQCPFGALFGDKAELGQFIAAVVIGQLGAAVGYAFESCALGLVQQGQRHFGFFGHSYAFRRYCSASAAWERADGQLTEGWAACPLNFYTGSHQRRPVVIPQLCQPC